MKRRFEFVQGSSSKFYEVTVTGNQVSITFGRIGTAGQSQARQFADAATAQMHADQVLAQKLGKGYVELQAAA